MKFKHVSHFLKTQRLRNNISQKELADTVGVHVQFISNVERSLATIPPNRIKKVAEALDADPKELFELHMEDYRLYAKKKAKL